MNKYMSRGRCRVKGRVRGVAWHSGGGGNTMPLPVIEPPPPLCCGYPTCCLGFVLLLGCPPASLSKSLEAESICRSSSSSCNWSKTLLATGAGGTQDSGFLWYQRDDRISRSFIEVNRREHKVDPCLWFGVFLERSCWWFIWVASKKIAC